MGTGARFVELQVVAHNSDPASLARGGVQYYTKARAGGERADAPGIQGPE